jgi:hypothetical protein
MKTLWWTSFRPFGLSLDNDNIQYNFLNSLKLHKNNIVLSVTQFGEANVEKSLVRSDINLKFQESSTKDFPANQKFSNKVMCENALKEFCLDFSDYKYLIYSTCDIIVPANLFLELEKIKLKNFMAYVFPNFLIKNGKHVKNLIPLYGIDIIIYKIDKSIAKKFLNLNYEWEQYGWGVNEHYFMSMKDALNLPSVNLWKVMDIIKFENDFSTFNESRKKQILEWNMNKEYFIRYLQRSNLSKYWATGSYFYILFRHFNFRLFSVSLLIRYLLMFLNMPVRALKKIFN